MIKKEVRNMKKIFIKYHKQIDYASVTLFLYSVFVLLCIKVFSFIDDESVYISLVLICPLIVCNRLCVNYFNSLLHRIFGFRR